jgi:hypothetical protein
VYLRRLMKVVDYNAETHVVTLAFELPKPMQVDGRPVPGPYAGPAIRLILDYGEVGLPTGDGLDRLGRSVVCDLRTV